MRLPDALTVPRAPSNRKRETTAAIRATGSVEGKPAAVDATWAVLRITLCKM